MISASSWQQRKKKVRVDNLWARTWISKQTNRRHINYCVFTKNWDTPDENLVSISRHCTNAKNLVGISRIIHTSVTKKEGKRQKWMTWSHTAGVGWEVYIKLLLLSHLLFPVNLYQSMLPLFPRRILTALLHSWCTTSLIYVQKFSSFVQKSWCFVWLLPPGLDVLMSSGQE